MTDDPTSILQALYDSEINWTISTFWDAGFRWNLGDNLDGFEAEGVCDSFAEAVSALKDAALRHYPESDFAKRFGH